ncbi:unnamed protein product, partial [Urochloa humidicola]
MASRTPWHHGGDGMTTWLGRRPSDSNGDCGRCGWNGEGGAGHSHLMPPCCTTAGEEMNIIAHTVTDFGTMMNQAVSNLMQEFRRWRPRITGCHKGHQTMKVDK